MTSERLSTQFHEKFSLSRQSVFQVIRTVENYPDIIRMSKPQRDSLFQLHTSLGPNYIKAMPQYARGSGLLASNYSLTEFGEFAIKYDSLLDQVGTQWLMHYHLGAPHGPGPVFWSEIVCKQLYTGNSFSTDEIADQIGNLIWQMENRILAEKGVRSTATIFLGTYTKPEGLGKLNLLGISDSGRFHVLEPKPTPHWAVGYALLDFWKANYPGRISIGLDTLRQSGFPNLFMLGNSELDDVLQTLQEARYVEMHRTAPPYQVVLLQQDSVRLLEYLYGAN